MNIHKKLVLAAIKQDVFAFEFASPQLQEDKDVLHICYSQWLVRVTTSSKSKMWRGTLRYIILRGGCKDDIINLRFKDGRRSWNLKYAPERIRNDKRIVMAAIKQDVFAFEYASPQLQEDKDVLDICYNLWLVRVKDVRGELRLEYAPERIRNDKRIVMAAIQKIGVVAAVKYASPQLQQDKDISYSVYQYWLSKVQTDWRQLQHAPDFSRLTYRNDLISAAFQQNIRALEFGSVNDKEAVLEAVQQNPWSFEFVPDCFRKDKDVVLAAMKIDLEILKFVHEDIKRDRDVLVAAGMFDENHVAAASSAVETKSIKKIALSTRFSLHSSSHSDATNFTKLFKGHPYIDAGNFKVYAPNAFDKKTCDPDWTNYDDPCRGTKDTCQFDDSLKTGHPTDGCCWRYSFRYQLNEAMVTGGFMLQLVEREVWGSKDPQSLGNGQRIEQEMANDIGVKIFQVYRPITSLGFEFPFDIDDIEEIVVPAIRGWYDGGCGDMSECILRPTR